MRKKGKKVMNKNERRWIILLVAVVIIAIVFFVLLKVGNKGDTGNAGEGQDVTTTNEVANEEKYVTELSDGTKLNNSEELNNTHTYKGVEISNIQFTSQNGSSVLLADVRNTGSTAFAAEEATIVLIGDNNEEREIALIIPSLAAGETKQINSIKIIKNIKAK